MPLVISRKDGQSQPTLACDSCREPIGDMESAIATFPSEGDDKGNLPVYVYHKGACDPGRQRDVPAHAVNSMELDQYLPWLIWNHEWGIRQADKKGDTVTLTVPNSWV